MDTYLFVWLLFLIIGFEIHPCIVLDKVIIHSFPLLCIIPLCDISQFIHLVVDGRLLVSSFCLLGIKPL